MTPDPLDQEQQTAFLELNQSRRIRDHGCGCDGTCRQDDAISEPLNIKDYE